MYDIQYLQIIAVMIKVNLASILCSRERDEHFMQPCEGKGNKNVAIRTCAQITEDPTGIEAVAVLTT